MAGCACEVHGPGSDGCEFTRADELLVQLIEAQSECAALRSRAETLNEEVEENEARLLKAKAANDAMRLALEDLVSHLDVEGWRTYPVHGSVEGMRSGLLAAACAVLARQAPAAPRSSPSSATEPGGDSRCAKSADSNPIAVAEKEGR